MSDEASEKQARLADQQQRAAVMLRIMADGVPDAVMDSWLQAGGFSALSDTKHGRALVREIMRATLAYVAAPLVAEQWLVKAELENQRDELRAGQAPKALPLHIPFFGEQLDVAELLAEVKRAQEEDRPCKGGEPQMVRRLAHVIRAYRGTETEDSAFRGLRDRALAGQPVAQTSGTSAQMDTDARIRLDLGAEADRRITAMSIDQWLIENGGPYKMPPEIAPLMPGFCRWVARTAAADYIGGLREQERKQREEHARQVDMVHAVCDAAGIEKSANAIKRVQALANEAESLREVFRKGGYNVDSPGMNARLANTVELLIVHDNERTEIQNMLTNAGINSVVNLKERVQFALNALGKGRSANEEKLNAAYIDLTHEMRDIARMLDTAGVATNLAGKDRVKWVVHEFNEMANERSRVHLLLTRAGMHPPRCLEADDTALRLDAFITVVDGALNKLDWPNNSDIIDRVQSLARIIDSKDAALAAVYQDIRAALGAQVDVTDADREAVFEDDAANGPDAREYYAERRALLRLVREHAKELRDVRKNLGCGSAYRDTASAAYDAKSAAVLLDDARALLRDAGMNVEIGTLVAIREIIEAHTFATDESTNEQAHAESPLHHCWSAGPGLDIPVSLPLIRGLATIMNEPMTGGLPSLHMRRQRLIRMYRAVLVLGNAFGVELDEHASDSPTEDGPVFESDESGD